MEAPNPSLTERALFLEFLKREKDRRAAEKDRYIWEKHARAEQLPPNNNKWSIFLALGGRGSGKTRPMNEFIRKKAFELKGSHGSIVARTAADIRDVVVETGESSLMKISPPDFMPNYEPSKRRLTWPNGSTATLYSAEEPNALRGHNSHWAAGDELAAWGSNKDDIETYSNLMFGLRLNWKGVGPQAFFASTPRPVKVIRDLVNQGKASKPTVIVRVYSTYANRANLAEKFFNEIITQYEGTRLGRQELDGELLEDIPGQLWTPDMFDDIRVTRDSLPEMVRIVVAIDPSVSSTENSDECGVSVAGLGIDGLYYLLKDASGVMSPSEWAKASVGQYHLWHADCIIGEKNNGGDLVESNLRTVDEFIPYRAVHASHGKAVRAQPIASLYEQRRVRHLLPNNVKEWDDPMTTHGKKRDTGFEKLETQYTGFTNEQYEGEGSPDRADAAIWALTELIDNGRVAARMFPDFRSERRKNGNGEFSEVPEAVHVRRDVTTDIKSWWPRWISASFSRSESIAHWWVREPSGRLRVYRELVSESAAPESFGMAIANKSVEEIQLQNSIPVWMAEDAFSRQGSKMLAASVSDGIKLALGEHKAFMFVQDDGEMRIADQNSRLRAIENRLARMPGGFLCIRALRGSKDSASGWDIVNDLLQWRRKAPAAKQEAPDWYRARALAANDITAYSAYMAQFTVKETAPTTLPLLWIDISAKRLIQAMGGAASEANGKLADSVSGSVLQSLRIGALASRENGGREPEEEFVARKMEQMPPGASDTSLHIQAERARQEYRGAGNEGVSLHRVKPAAQLRVM